MGNGFLNRLPRLGKVVLTVGGVALVAQAGAMAYGDIESIDRSNGLGQALMLVPTSTATNGGPMMVQLVSEVPNMIEGDGFSVDRPADQRMVELVTDVSSAQVHYVHSRW